MSDREYTPEMVELRRLLDERGIEWTDYSDPVDQWTKYGMNRLAMQRTKFLVKGQPVGSVIYGYGSYGEGTGLLEAYMPNESDPVGHLKAAEIVTAWFGEVTQ
ncbi:MAG: hypothetical protein RR505_10455 [Raoultibacter sp.]